MNKDYRKILWTLSLFGVLSILTACGNSEKSKQDDMPEVIQNNQTSELEEGKEKVTNNEEIKEIDKLQSEILTLKKVGELEKPGDDKKYYFSVNDILIVSTVTNDFEESEVINWRGDIIGGYQDVGGAWDDEVGYFAGDGEIGICWYNQNGDVSLKVSYDDYEDLQEQDLLNVTSGQHAIIYRDDVILGVFDRKNGKYIPDLPPINQSEDINSVGENIWLQNETAAEIYDCDGLVKRIEENEMYYAIGHDNYLEIICRGEEADIHKIYNEYGDFLFSFVERNSEGWTYELHDAGKGGFIFIINKGAMGSYVSLVDEQGNILCEYEITEFKTKYDIDDIMENTIEFYNNENISCLRVNSTYIFYDENGVYFETTEEELFYEFYFDYCKYGIRYLVDHSQMTGAKTYHNIKIHYLTSGIEEEIEHVDNPFVDVFYSKDGNLYSYVDGSLALEGDYNNYYYAYGRIYAENKDLSYDIFEIVEYNPPYEYKSLGTGEILGNIAAN